MGLIVLIALGVIFYFYIFHESKSDLRKIKEALKDASTDDLKFANELINNELKKRTANAP